MKKNIKAGKINHKFNRFILALFLSFFSKINYVNSLEGDYTSLRILDKISSKNTLINLKNGKEIKHEDLLIKSLKCRNSEFDDDPEITAYIQVKDTLNKNKNDVFVFNGWIFSSSPSIVPFDHPVYDIWLVSCN